MGAVLQYVLNAVCSIGGDERIAREYLDLRQGTESVTEIIKMSTERAMFYHELSRSFRDESPMINSHLIFMLTNAYFQP